MSKSLKPIDADEALDILGKHLDEIVSRYNGVTESPVNKWRRKHKRCEFCEYYKPLGPSNGVCVAKNKRVSSPSGSRRFCRVFLLKPYKEEIE